MRVLAAFIVAATLFSCAQKEEPFQLAGKAQGTTFSIKYHGPNAVDLSQEVSDALNGIDESLSLWRPDSFISQVNARTDSMVAMPRNDVYFMEVFKLAKKVFQESKGAFDPSIYPLIKAWGFGAVSPDSEDVPDVDSLREAIMIGGFDVVLAEVGPEKLFILPRGMQLDFNAIAQGYSVDVIAEILEDKGITDYMVEIGGEVRANGVRPDGKAWNIGIDRPIEDGERSLIKEVQVEDESLATSGNYRKAVMRGGKRYSHTIDPETGYPVTHNLLSATVVTKSCALADAYATVCMVLGTEKALDFAERKNLDVYLIYDDNGVMKEKGTGRFAESN
ncbi:MAG: FAD:protein FMN transferase [Bacteroidetes bacterium]|nr:FAD:protein FMN transferase [Bacteroidota bacterium]MDA0973189.1 FAD:protein FMN transferase [Bacteroidota bacterium]